MSGTVTEHATATLSGVQTGPGLYRYTVSLTNDGSVPLGIFWFAWDDFPDQDFMSAPPQNIAAPSGWVALTTSHAYASGTGYGIDWYTFDPANRIAPGATVAAFGFTSTLAPADFAGPSPFDPSFATTSAFVYQTASAFPAPADPGFNLTASVACFLAGTRIAVPGGVCAVEDLSAGDLVATLAGENRPIRWIGHRAIDTAGHPAPESLWPVRVSRGGLDDGVPSRDLFLSPDHALFIDGVLVPVRYLINGTTIVQVPARAVTYYHVELDDHDVIMAEGAPAETYFDTGDRMKFDGKAQMRRAGSILPREVVSGLPLVVTGPMLAALRRRIDRRAAAVSVTA